MNWLRRKWFILVVLVALVGIGSGFVIDRAPKARYFTASVQRGSIRDTVQATGSIDAVTTVQVGSEVSGMISALYADFNSPVHKGQVIAQIDPSLFQGAVLQAEADLQNARATLAAAKAELAKSQATATQATADYGRQLPLAKDGILSQQQLDAAKATADSAAAAVASAQAQVTEAAAQVQQKSAALQVAKTNLDHTIIRAPIDGTVTARNVDVGQTVAASLQAPTLFNIAQDLTKMRVYAKTDESDVGRIRVGEPATFTVDAFPKEVFQGRVVQVRMNATTVQNVVTYDTVIEFDNPQIKLFPGMTAYVTIPVANADNVVEVANGALRYKPELKPDQVRAVYAKYGIRSQDLKPANSSAQTDYAVIWKVAGDATLQPVEIRTGITDHTNTEVKQVIAGSLTAGDKVVLGTESSSSGAARAAVPGMGGGVPRH